MLVTHVSLCACGKSANKEDMLANAIELNWRNVYDEYLANETYNGLPLNGITVYLSKEEIIELDKYKKITVVGKLNLPSFTSISNAFIVD